MSYLDAFQQIQGEWAEDAFPEADVESPLHHLKKEVVTELLPAEQNGAPKEQCREEAAGAFLLLLTYAHKKGFSLIDAAHEKHTKNRQREWGPPDENGVYEHT